jgi:hypothetical protein
MERNEAISFMILFMKTSDENRLFNFLNTNNKKLPDNIGKVPLLYWNTFLLSSLNKFSILLKIIH